jgi:hypothetical protein
MATATSALLPDGLKKSLLVVVAAAAAFFVYDNALRYFTWTEAAYGYYWAYRLPLIAHVTGGVIALLAGVWQVWTGLNTQSMGVHPWTGRLYVLGVVLGSLGAFVLAFTSAVFGFAWAVALICLAIAWLTTTGMAWYSIHQRNLLLHKQWMIRSYLVTFAFVTFRIITDYLPYEAWWGISRPDMSNAAIWPVWVMPLLAYEIRLALARKRT